MHYWYFQMRTSLEDKLLQQTPRPAGGGSVFTYSLPSRSGRTSSGRSSTSSQPQTGANTEDYLDNTAYCTSTGQCCVPVHGVTTRAHTLQIIFPIFDFQFSNFPKIRIANNKIFDSPPGQSNVARWRILFNSPFSFDFRFLWCRLSPGCL